MLQAPQARSPHKRGHAHKRSAAISGDFDLEFFKGPSIAEALEKSDVLPVTPPSEPHATFKSRNLAKPPAVVISVPTSTPSPKKNHQRLNSWAHTMVKTKPKEKSEYCSSSETTPEHKKAALNYSYVETPQKYEIPEAIIDLDLAAGVYYDPATNKYNPKIQHRRTESAPELEDFFKCSFNSSKGSRKNSAIFEEEEEEDDEDVLSSTSSTNAQLNHNPSIHSLDSSSSNNTKYPSVISTPTSTKTRRGGATAARYQSYYNNNLLLSNALKSSESLSRVTNDTAASSLHKPSYSSFQRPSSSSSTNSSVLNSPSRFKFESRVYDMPSSQSSRTNLSVEPNGRSSPSPQKTIAKTHRKSKSLLSSISQKMRGNSFSSMKDLDDSANNSTVVLDDDHVANNTLTDLNFGEPGPILDLATMTPKYNYELDDMTHATAFSPKTKTERKSKKGFFHWMKK